MIYIPISRMIYSPISREIYSPISRMIYSPISREIYVFVECSLASGVHGECGCQRQDGSCYLGWTSGKLASMALRLFAPDASYPPTYANPLGE